MPHSQILDAPISTYLGKVFANREIISLDSEASLKDALRELAKYRILSAPVRDASKKVIGLIDVLDIASFTRELYFENNESYMKNYLLQFSFDVQTVKDVMDISKKNPFVAVKRTDSLRAVLQHAATGVHRVCIVDEQGDVSHIITQSDMFKFVFENHELKNALTPSLKKTVHAMKLGQQKSLGGTIYSVKNDAMAIDAFKYISDHGVSAIAIVDEKDNVIGTISASDLQGFLGEELHALALNVVEFQKMAKKKREVASQIKLTEGVVFCKPESTFAEAVERIATHRVHRIYIMVEGGKMEGIIALTDVLKAVIDVLA